MQDYQAMLLKGVCTLALLQCTWALTSPLKRLRRATTVTKGANVGLASLKPADLKIAGSAACLSTKEGLLKPLAPTASLRSWARGEFWFCESRVRMASSSFLVGRGALGGSVGQPPGGASQSKDQSIHAASDLDLENDPRTKHKVGPGPTSPLSAVEAPTED